MCLSFGCNSCDIRAGVYLTCGCIMVSLTPVCCRANEEIAQVRSRADAECVGLNASLRKEQMKVESLERALEQKVHISIFS